MSKIYAIEKATNKLTYISDNLALLKGRIAYDKKDIENFYILEDFDMKYISRIAYVDGTCVYNNKDYWINTAKTDLENLSEHEVLDFLGNTVNEIRFATEMNSNITRISAIDGLAGEIEYNITVGNEFIALFREECVKTDFKGITPLQIGIKLSPVISLVQTGSFREAKQVLQSLETDAFLTKERIAKYISMMDSADAIEYATEEGYYYTAEEIEEVREDVFTRVTTTWAQNDFNSYRYPIVELASDDKYIMVIRHADRDSGDTGKDGDINETGLKSATTIGDQIAYGKVVNNKTVDIEANDAHYFSTDYVRTRHTAQAIAAARGDTDSAATDYSGITDATETLVAERFLKQAKDSGNTDLLKRYIYSPDTLTEEELTINIGVATVEEAQAKLLTDANTFIQEIIALSDKRLNVFVTHDYFVGPLVGAITNRQLDLSSNWINYEAGIGIILHSDNTFEAFPIRCKGSGYYN